MSMIAEALGVAAPEFVAPYELWRHRATVEIGIGVFVGVVFMMIAILALSYSWHVTGVLTLLISLSSLAASAYIFRGMHRVKRF